jgi:YHS domain-containing protein
MKIVKSFTATALAISILGGPFMALAGDQPADSKAKVKPYTLKTCVISGDKLGEMGKPYVFEYKGREVKLCCKNCLKDFNQNPAKYVKQIEEAEAKAKKSKT